MGFLNFCALILKIYHFCGPNIFLLLIRYPFNSIFWCQYVVIRCFWWNIFPLKYQNAYGDQTFQGGDMRPWALTHKCAWHLNGVVFLGQVTDKIHISTCRRCIGKMLTWFQRLPNVTLWSSDQDEVMWLLEKSVSLFSWGLLLMNLAGCWLYEGYSSCKCLSCHRLLILKFLRRGRSSFLF